MKNLLLALGVAGITGIAVFAIQEARYQNIQLKPAVKPEVREIYVKSDLDEKLPVVIYSPGGLFSDEEKLELQNKLINPFFDYQNSEEIDFITMIINKEQNPADAGHTYTVSAISKNGIYNGFIFGENDEINWWTPTCMGGCIFPEGYEEKYPEVVNATL